MEENKNLAIAERAEFSFVRYANCWEDADILMEALSPREGGNYLSIASAGDNSFALLKYNPDLVLAIDLNPVQLACTELKKEAIRNLNYEELLQFLGIKSCSNRQQVYQKIREKLSIETRRYWDAHPDELCKGINHIGKFENYFHIFRKWCLPLIHSKKRIKQLLEKKGREDRIEFFQKRWENRRWKALFALFFSKRMMGKLGRDPEFFRYVKEKVAKNIYKRATHGLTEVPLDQNPYIEYILTGNFQNALPFYLRKENYLDIKKNLDKLICFQGDLSAAFIAYSETKFDGFNLSDIFEYMSQEEYELEMRAILNASTPKARIAFWNMLAHRKEGKSFEKDLAFLDEEAERLHKQDKAFFYQSFIIGTPK